MFSQIISVINQKGGVGKTTTVINLAASIAAIEKRVLVIDMDPQANASSGLGVYEKPLEKNIYSALIDSVELLNLVCDTELPYLKIVPSGSDLYGAEIELANLDERLFCLKKSIESISHEYDFIFIDCPPALGLLTLNALATSNSIIIPMQCEYYALEGLSQLMRTFESIKSNINSKLEIEGILFTMYDKRNNLSRQVVDDVKKHFGKNIFNTIIPRNIRLSEAPSFGKPILLYDIKSKGAQSYLALTQELLKKHIK